MKLPAKENLLWPIGVLGLASVLIALAVLQYRWSQELTDAASDRMRAGLQSSMMGYREDLGRELQAISLALQGHSNTGSTDSVILAERFDSWKAAAEHPELVEAIYLAAPTGDNGLQLQKLNTATRQFETVAWPQQLSGIEDSLSRLSAEMQQRLRRFEALSPRPVAGMDRFRGGGPPSPPSPWFIDESVPALLHAEIAGNPSVRLPNTEAAGKVTWLVVQLNEDVLRQRVLPELAKKYFADKGELTYEVAVTSRNKKDRIFYSSSNQFGSGLNVPTDARLKLFGPPIGIPMPQRGDMIFRTWRDPRPEHRGFGLLFRLEPISRNNVVEGDWELIVKHRKGSLEAAMVSIRRGHLIISFAVLLVLAVTMAMIIVASRRAHRLASLQMQFVAGVSHELRTPLAVIASAADNIADGIVEDKNRIARYGKVIRDQSRQLTQLVEQILLFAATRQNGYQYNLRRVAAAEIVDIALANSGELLRSSRFTVERQGDRSCYVMADVPALTHCLQNIIANAVKYGGDARWIGISVQESETDSRGREVKIAVKDKGIGIDPKEQQRIFDAFYRSPSVISAQIHGTGLGLALAKGIATAMGGRLSLISTPGEGSTFTLHLPCAEEPAPAAQEEMTAAVGSPARDA